mmetsp:Transcript_81468/g.209776  ORF Transcript_81468/g.209776 Transcript_81468/m.209776 type:complete len:201 (+) Transcript_81468:2352-2954(+)
MQRRVPMSQTRTVRSAEPLTQIVPSSLSTRARTFSVCPRRRHSRVPLRGSQPRTTQDAVPQASNEALRVIASDQTDAPPELAVPLPLPPSSQPPFLPCSPWPAPSRERSCDPSSCGMYCPLPENWPTVQRCCAAAAAAVPLGAPRREEPAPTPERCPPAVPPYGSPSPACTLMKRVAASRSEITTRASSPADARRALCGA